MQRLVYAYKRFMSSTNGVSSVAKGYTPCYRKSFEKFCDLKQQLSRNSFPQFSGNKGG